MKILTVLAAAAFSFAGAAHALQCDQVLNPTARYTYIYEVKVAKNEKSARVIKNSSEGSELVDTLQCEEAEAAERPGNGGINPTYPLLKCVSNAFDDGFVLDVTYQPVIHMKKAVLSEVTNRGTRPVARFTCK